MQTDYDNATEYGLGDMLPPGTALLNGQYVIERYLSSGGFGITYLARDSLERTVVIKECFPSAFCGRVNKTVQARSQASQADFRAFVDLFVREARSLARIDHPNVVGVHQVFQDNQTAYMALDLVKGHDLLDLIEGVAPPAPEQVMAWLPRLLDAVGEVHANDMLHRDISPDNILIDVHDKPVLIDFGAAREEASKKSRAMSALLVVKDGYSPQEFYIAGSKQAPCSDLYALAATFWHLISGEAPPNSQARLAAIASHQPDPCRALAGRIAGYPEPFLRAIDDAMRLFPGDRIQTAAEWAARINPNAPVPAPNAARAPQSTQAPQPEIDGALEQRLSQLVAHERRDAAQRPAAPRKTPATPADKQTPRPAKCNPDPAKAPERREPTIAEMRQRKVEPVNMHREAPDYIQAVWAAWERTREMMDTPDGPNLPPGGANVAAPMSYAQHTSTEPAAVRLGKYTLAALVTFVALGLATDTHDIAVALGIGPEVIVHRPDY
ncbi:serine/threonine protein kinase [Arenibacterium halophilum]|uniref:Serine/threonine protein kinase n=1 Tax=Arenibacterium halophilum TaxID=2583821 RepID=A0ABY2XFT2_9RHOB|nr:serine/threonine-protein kinase [Arenibacterium halophilum]TMV15491.1 serine/threonine protein kinase [Arenibacterium halophilum]